MTTTPVYPPNLQLLPRSWAMKITQHFRVRFPCMLLEISTSCICLETFSFIYYTSTKIKIKAPVVKRERRNVRDTVAVRQVRSSHRPTVNKTTGARKQQSEARAAPGFFRPPSRSVAESRRHITAQLVSFEKSWGGQSSSVIVIIKVWLVESSQEAEGGVETSGCPD